jgi:hypothetical protein
MDDILPGFAFMLVVLGQCLAVIAVQYARHEDWSAHRSDPLLRVANYCSSH